MFKHTILFAAGAGLVLALAAASANAGVVPVTIAYGHNNKDNYGGNILDTYNGSGMNGVVYPADQTSWPPATDPSTWTYDSSSYRDEWQSGVILDSGTSINSKIGWIIFDLGSVVAALDKMYLWNLVQGGNSGMRDFNLYSSNTPVVPANQGPTNSTSVDYDFGVAAWTNLNTTGVLTLAKGNGGAAEKVVDLGSISARYLALEILSRQPGATGTRTGLAEVGITAIPEPATLALLGLGGLGLILGRKHR